MDGIGAKVALLIIRFHGSKTTERKMRRYSVPCRAPRAIFEPCSFSRFPKKETLKKSWLTDSFLRLNDFVHLSIVSLLASGPRFIGPCFV